MTNDLIIHSKSILQVIVCYKNHQGLGRNKYMNTFISIISKKIFIPFYIPFAKYCGKFQKAVLTQYNTKQIWKQEQ